VPDVDARAGGGVVIQLAGEEADLLRSLASELVSFLGLPHDPTDPAAARLFPAAHEDPVEQQAYTELVGDELRTMKIEAAGAVRTALGDSGPASVEVDAAGVEAWLMLLTDLRLAIGERIGIDEEKMAAPLDPADPDALQMSVLHWLGWLQELILQALGA
jgi:hypothetical protein